MGVTPEFAAVGAWRLQQILLHCPGQHLPKCPGWPQEKTSETGKEKITCSNILVLNVRVQLAFPLSLKAQATN